jgi:hypothetical protein
MTDLILSQSYSPVENSELSFELNYTDINYSPQLSNELSLIENSNTLTDNINYDNALYEVFGNNHNIDSENDDISERNSNVHIEIDNSQMNSNSNHQKFLGRKRKDSKSTGDHNEYSEDNLLRKFKIYNIETFRTKINSELKTTPVFIENNGKKYEAKKLLKIKQEFAKNITVNETRNFLNKKIKTIFSADISDLYKNYPKNYNQLVIEKLYEENKTNVTCILEKSVLECIKYFRKDEDAFSNEENSCLKGIERRYESLPQDLRKKGFKDDYIKSFFKLVKDFENIIEKKSPRRARRTRTNNEAIDVSR